MEFRPFVMFMNPANYSSDAVNTDRLGFRHQYDPWGNLIDLERLDAYDSCDVFIGNSAAFGVDASSDKTTVAAVLSTQRYQRDGKFVPLVNLAVRGATMQQELATFLVARKFLPPVRNIISMSGIIEAMYCIMNRAIFYPDFGAVNNDTGFFYELSQQYVIDPDPFNRWLRVLHESIDRRLHGSSLARFLFRQYGKIARYSPRLAKMVDAPPIPALEEGKREAVFVRLQNDLENWSAIARGIGARMHYVLQPTIGWTNKKLSTTEQKIMVVDRINIPSLARYAHQEFHQPFAADVRRLCREAQIDFHDANLWFDSPEYAERTLFTDVCHMSDEGSEVLAARLDTHLRWNERIDVAAEPRLAMPAQ